GHVSGVARDDVEMGVPDRLARSLPGVDAKVVGVGGVPLVERRPDRVHEGHDGGLLLGREGEEVGLVATGDDQRMAGAHRKPGGEGDRQVVGGQEIGAVGPLAEDAAPGGGGAVAAHALPRALSALHTRSHSGRIVGSATEYRTVRPSRRRPTISAASRRLRCCETLGAASPTAPASSVTVMSSRSSSTSRIRSRVGSDNSENRRATSSTSPAGTVTASQYTDVRNCAIKISQEIPRRYKSNP